MALRVFCREVVMFDNPFVPVFGGKPDFFFGRSSILNRFSYALHDRGSEDRALFVTGNRGCGKTALLEQLSTMASAAGWQTIDLNAEKALNGFVRGLMRHDSVTKSIEPELEVTVLGSGARVGGYSSSKTTTFSVDDIEVLLIEACAKASKGVFVSVDEIQKLAPEDFSVICGAFQMASRKGCDVILAVAGLPYAHEEVIQYKGCTYMRRAVHERLGVFDPREARSVLGEAFGHIEGLEATPDALDELTRLTFGHPYLIQLAGYYLVSLLNERNGQRRKASIAVEDVRESFPAVLAAYENRALRPIVDALSPAESEYLGAMAAVIHSDRTVLTREVADRLGKSQQSTSPARDGLVKEGIVVSTGYGKLMFNMPYLQSYLLKDRPEEDEARLARAWGF